MDRLGVLDCFRVISVGFKIRDYINRVKTDDEKQVFDVINGVGSVKPIVAGIIIIGNCYGRGDDPDYCLLIVLFW